MRNLTILHLHLQLVFLGQRIQVDCHAITKLAIFPPTLEVINVCLLLSWKHGVAHFICDLNFPARLKHTIQKGNFFNNHACSCSVTCIREPLLKGKLSTVDLLALTGLDLMLLIFATLFTFFPKTSYLNQEVNCTEPSLSVSVLWLYAQKRILMYSNSPQGRRSADEGNIMKQNRCCNLVSS